MKRFFSTLLSAILLVTSTLTAVAFDTSYYVFDLTPVECSLTVDGKILPCAPGYIDSLDVYYRYTSVAEALGFEVTFSDETGMVNATYNGTFISCSTDGFDIFVTSPDGTSEELNFIYTIFINIDDRMYVSKHGIQNLLQNYTNRKICFDAENETNLSVYTESGIRSMIASVNKELSVLNQIQSTFLIKDYTSSGTSKVTINLGSDFFGIEGTGDSVITTTSAKRGEKTYWKTESTGSGLMNLFMLLENSYDIDPETLPVNESMEFFSDGKTLYVKNPSLTKAMFEEEDHGFTYIYSEAADAVLNQWTYAECTQKKWEEYFLNPAGVGTFIVNLAFDMSDEPPQKMIDMFLTLLSDKNFSVTNSAGGKTYTYKMDKTTFLEALAPTISVMSEEERAEFEKTMSPFDIHISMKQNIKNSGSTNTSNCKISLANIPNPWNAQVFSMDICIDSSQTTSFTNATKFAFPDVSNAINITEYIDKTYSDIYEKYEDYE